VLQYLLISLAGLAGSVHCIGMCGGFVCVMGRDPRGAAATLRRHLIYNLGRVTTLLLSRRADRRIRVLLVGTTARRPRGASRSARWRFSPVP